MPRTAKRRVYRSPSYSPPRTQPWTEAPGRPERDTYFDALGLHIQGDHIRYAWNYAWTLSAKDKKAVVVCCRAQHIPDQLSTTRLAAVIGFDSCHTMTSTDCHKDLHFYFRHFGDLIRSPLYSSMIIDFMRCAPLRPDEIHESKVASFSKEIRVMESQPLPSTFNYPTIFDPARFNEPFHHTLKPNPRMASFVYQILFRWRQNCTLRPIYPRISPRKVALGTIRGWEENEGRKWNEETQGIFTQHVLERYMHDTGHSLESPVEIRQKWYKAGLTPRSYYAMGGTAYRLSKFTQNILGDLVDSLPSTNHVSRLNPTRITPGEDRFLLIYDLSSFTSNHHEQRHFINALAEFCLGYTVTVVDAVHGFMERDLGLLLYEYNQMNHGPEYSMERVSDEFLSRVQVHNIAGFLGVYGNLMSCTFCHGASVLQLLETPDDLNVAGDDGHFPVHSDDEADRSMGIIRANGVVETTKMFKTSEEGAVCLKRGLIQIGGRLLQKRMLVFPSLAAIQDCTGMSPSHFSMRDVSMVEKRSVVAMEVIRFLKSLQTYDLEDDEAETVLLIVVAIYLSCSLPSEGSVPQLGGEYLCAVMPQYKEDLRRDPIKYVLGYHWRNCAFVPKRMKDVDLSDASAFSWENETYVGPSTRYLSYMETLGYLTSEPESILVFGADGFDRLCREFDEFSPRIYTFTVISVPDDAFRSDLSYVPSLRARSSRSYPHVRFVSEEGGDSSDVDDYVM